MPAFDPVRDAVLNSPIDSPSRSPSLGRRATDLSVLLNDDDDDIHHRLPFHRPTSSIHALLADDTLSTTTSLRRASTSTISTPELERPGSSRSLNQLVAKPLPLAYNPKRRTAPDMVLIPLSQDEIQKYRNYCGQGVKRLTTKRKRSLSDERDPADTRMSKRHAGDVGVVVQHCQSIFFFFCLVHNSSR